MKRLAILLLALPLAAAAEAPFDPFGVASIERGPGVAVPVGLSVRDSTGRATTLAAIADGRPMLLVPVLHDCPNICGVTLAGVADAVAGQPYRAGADFVVIGFGIDPDETPADAASARAELVGRRNGPALAEGLAAVTAPAATVAAVTDALGYRYGWDARIGQYAHIAATAVLTPDGRLSRWLYGIQPQPTDLRLALTEAGEGRIGGLAEQLLLLCYQYDPRTGRYNSAVWWLLRGTGGLTLLLIGGFIGLALHRERRARTGGRA